LSITIFSTPKEFKGITKVDQYNAVISWKKFLPGVQILLIGDDVGTDLCALTLGVQHIKECESNKLGTPFLSSVFSQAQKNADFEILMYINADIVFTHDISSIISTLISDIPSEKSFLATGQRYDTDVKFELDKNEIPEKIEEQLTAPKANASRHGPAGLDYFIFRRNTFRLPAFLIGRPCWDNWLLWHCFNEKFMIIDATSVLNILHQNHDYSHSKSGGKGRVLGPEWNYNVKISGGYGHQENLKCHTHLFRGSSIMSKPKFKRVAYKIYSVVVGRTLVTFIRYARYLLKNR
jgi:hypothetical protein